MILVLLSIIVISHLFYGFYWKRRHLPPGPMPIPLIGNLNMMNDQVKPGYTLWEKMSEKYGPINTFWVAHIPVVIVTDWNLIRKHFIKDGSSFASRPRFPLSIEIRGGQYGLIESDGNLWAQHRRFVLQTLRNFGMGSNLMEEKVISELCVLISTLKTFEDPIDVHDLIYASIGSIINNLLFGYRYDETNIEEFLILKTKLAEYLHLIANPIGGFLNIMPFFKNFPFLGKYKNGLCDNVKDIYAIFRKKILEKEKTIFYDSEDYSNFVEAYLKERKRHENELNYDGFCKEQLVSICFDLWAAGMDTVSNTLSWAILYVIRNPSVKEKIYAELDSVVGSDRIIRSSERNRLSFVMACINETQRLANLVPMNIMRETSNEVEIAGYRIPKRTKIVPQISSILYDKKVFTDPYSFDPERFIDVNGSLKRFEEFVPFSVGKRQCLGESLARLELFIFFANIFNQFDISPDPLDSQPSIEKDYGITMRPKSFRILLRSRYG